MAELPIKLTDHLFASDGDNPDPGNPLLGIGTSLMDKTLTVGDIVDLAAAGGSDSGWRDVSASLINGYTGTLVLRRIGDVVYVRGSINCTGRSSNTMYTLLAGWRCTAVQSIPRSDLPHSEAHAAGSGVYASASVLASANITVASLLIGGSYVTGDDFSETPIGNAAT
jgi:hypothetical protein